MDAPCRNAGGIFVRVLNKSINSYNTLVPGK